VKFAVADDPVIVAPPGVAVTVHAEVGKLLKAIVAVATVQVGCVMVPTAGAPGVTGCVLTTAVPEEADVHPDEAKVTAKVYVVPAVNRLKFAVAVDPVIVAPPGEAVTVHEEVGSPLKATVPVATVQVGCVIVPTVGAAGTVGCALITAFPEAADVHPDEVKVTLKV
jgi:hypothetical protein